MYPLTSAVSQRERLRVPLGRLGLLGDVEKRLKRAPSGPEQRERPGWFGDPLGSVGPMFRGF
jgi:hypothetical protein